MRILKKKKRKNEKSDFFELTFNIKLEVKF